MKTRESARKMVEQLCAGADHRKQRSLRLIYDICVEEQEKGSDDYRVSTIGKFSSARGGPGAGTIRNRSGEAYRAIIATFAKEVPKTKRRDKDKALDEADEILEGIADPVIRTRVNLLLAELRSLRGQLLAAKHLANESCSIRIEDRGGTGGQEGGSGPHLTELEGRALRSALSAETLEHWGWTVDEHGRVLSDTGQTVFRMGFVNGIQKVLEWQEEAGKGAI